MSNFRGFTQLDAPVGRVTAIIGPNSKGKTSVLHAVRLAVDVLNMTLESDSTTPHEMNGQIVVWKNEVLQDPTRLISLSDWRQIFTDARIGEGVTSEVDLHFGSKDPIQRLKVTLGYGRNAQAKLTVEVSCKAASQEVKSIAKKSKYRPSILLSKLRDSAPIATFVPAFYGVTRVEEYRTRPIMKRALGGGDQSHIVRNLVARLDQSSLTRLNSFLGRALGAKIENRTSSADADAQPELWVTYRDTNGELELSSAGAGMVSLVALFAAMEQSAEERLRTQGRPVIFLLDEPEAHLHPKLQGDVGVELTKLASEFGIQLVLATHSVEMINRIGQQEHTTLLAVDRTSVSPLVVLQTQRDIINNLASFCDLTPFTSLSFLASRRILFHEGPSDLRILDVCARLLFRSDPERQTRWRAYTPVSLNGVGNANAQAILKSVLTPELFPDVKSAPVRAVLVRDRDCSRTPSAPARSLVAGHFELIDVVWSRYSIESLFLDEAILLSWLSALLPVIQPDLPDLVKNAILDANKNLQLSDAACDARSAVLQQRDSNEKRLDQRRANELARQEVRGQPEIWQHGRNRAKHILHFIRSALPNKIQTHVRKDIVGFLEATPLDTIRDPTQAIPTEIVALLRAMTEP